MASRLAHAKRQQAARSPGFQLKNPISIPSDLRHAYYHALEAADSGDFQIWLDFLTQQLDQELDQWLSALEDTRPKT